MKRPPPPDEVVDADSAAALRLIVQSATIGLRNRTGLWPSHLELMAYLANVLNLDMDDFPYCEAVRWVTAGRMDPHADDDYGIVVYDEGPPNGTFRAVVPYRVIGDVEAWLHDQRS